ncbi:FAD-dependent oxidoreductase, partial [bacterium]|nr:FAD-dependent oxidoreductase [bacterium]
SWYWAHPPGYQTYGCMMDMAAKVKKVVKIPVIAVGRLNMPELAGKVIAEGKADIVAIGRGLMADPFWVKKIEEGRQEHIRPCLGCHQGCMGRLVLGKPISCAVNPACGRERSYAFEPAHRSKNIMVIGGGIAGMEAARVAGLRGHKVVIYEKTDKLGGHVTEASVMPFKGDDVRLLNWYKTKLEDRKVEINFNTEVTPALVQEENPDAVIVAAGSKPIELDLPGADKEMVVTATDLLVGKKQAGDNVVVIGGGQVGCETALWLVQQGKRVTIVESLGDLMVADSPIPLMNRMMLLDLLNFHKVNVMTNVSLLEIIDDGAVLIDKSFRKSTLIADTLVVAVGFEPEQEVYRLLHGRIPNLYIIGDAREARNIMSAIWDAYEVARAI